MSTEKKNRFLELMPLLKNHTKDEVVASSIQMLNRGLSPYFVLQHVLLNYGSGAAEMMNKILATLESCKNIEQMDAIANMITTFSKRFPKYEELSALLWECFKHKSEMLNPD